MTREADFAFRQAIALWPASQESCSAGNRYWDLLDNENRQSDARLLQARDQEWMVQLNR